MFVKRTGDIDGQQEGGARVEEESFVRHGLLTKYVISQCKEGRGKGEWSRCFQAL